MTYDLRNVISLSLTHVYVYGFYYVKIMKYLLFITSEATIKCFCLLFYLKLRNRNSATASTSQVSRSRISLQAPKQEEQLGVRGQMMTRNCGPRTHTHTHTLGVSGDDELPVLKLLQFYFQRRRH